jgi:hypothetical protein
VLRRTAAQWHTKHLAHLPQALVVPGFRGVAPGESVRLTVLPRPCCVAVRADGLVDDDLRAQLLGLLVDDEFAAEPPAHRGWERRTVDDVDNPSATWGLGNKQLACLKSAGPVVELNSRLATLYGEGCQWYYMPTGLIQSGSLQRQQHARHQRLWPRIHREPDPFPVQCTSFALRSDVAPSYPMSRCAHTCHNTT